MSKRVQQTPEVLARLSKAVGKTVNEGDYVVYECVALNTLPLRQKGTLFNSAKVNQSTLTEMAAFIQGQETVPLQLMHDTGVLPVGRVFWAETSRDNYGNPELRAQFFVSNEHPDVIAKIDDGTVDEVSVGFSAKSITCSKCGFDYLGDKASFENIWSLTCDNGHEIGSEGVHTNVSGLSMWHEMSLVGKGAANGAKILRQTSEQATALAASGHGKSLILQLTATKEPPMTEATPPKTNTSTSQDPNLATVDLAQLTGLATDKANLTIKLATTEAALTAATTQVADLTAKLTASEEQAKAEAAKLAAESDAALSFLKDQAKKLNVALGSKDAAVPDDVAGLIKHISDGQAKLSSLIPAGGVSWASIGDAHNGQPKLASLAAFKTTAR